MIENENKIFDTVQEFLNRSCAAYSTQIAKQERDLSSFHGDFWDDEIRTKYIQNPPEGMTASDIKAMSDDDLLDMHYFLEDDDFDPEDEVGAEGFYIF